uniref:FBD domain-containing protein n=1 Tax=Panagrellus redivivus TaxID=6233 RepID=A0A7E5A0W1_PANRE
MFPVMSLPYGLLCRLGTLSSPVEKYHLQVAGGNFNICPPTIQPCKKENCHLDAVMTSELTLEKYSEAERKHVPVDLDDDDNTLISESNTLSLNSVEMKHLSSNVFNHFLINAPRLNLQCCDTSLEFLRALSKLCVVPVKDIEFDLSLYRDFCFKSVFEAFPHASQLQFKNAYFPDNWLTEIMKIQKTKLLYLYINTEPEDVGKFEADELIEFLLAQHERVTLTLEFYELSESDEYAKMLKKILKKHLVSKDTHFIRPEQEVRVLASDFRWSYYLPQRRADKWRVEGPRVVVPRKRTKKRAD